MNQKGKLTTLGCGFLTAKKSVASEDSAMVKLYLKAGAIPLVSGDVPQTCMMLHTKNLIFGEARNPLR